MGTWPGRSGARRRSDSQLACGWQQGDIKVAGCHRCAAGAAAFSFAGRDGTLMDGASAAVTAGCSGASEPLRRCVGSPQLQSRAGSRAVARAPLAVRAGERCACRISRGRRRTKACRHATGTRAEWSVSTWPARSGVRGRIRRDVCRPHSRGPLRRRGSCSSTVARRRCVTTAGRIPPGPWSARSVARRCGRYRVKGLDLTPGLALRFRGNSGGSTDTEECDWWNGPGRFAADCIPVPRQRAKRQAGRGVNALGRPCGVVAGLQNQVLKLSTVRLCADRARCTLANNVCQMEESIHRAPAHYRRGFGLPRTR